MQTTIENVTLIRSESCSQTSNNDDRDTAMHFAGVNAANVDVQQHIVSLALDPSP